MPRTSKRDRFVLEYLHLVESIARRYSAKLPPALELEDLIQEGMLGLLDAAQTYDPARGASESTWATAKIIWAMRAAVHGKNSSTRRRAGTITAYEWAVRRAPLDDDSQPEPADPPADPRQAAVAEAVQTLPARQRAVIERVYENGESLWSLSQAKAFGIGWRVLRNEHTRALDALRPLLEKAA